MRPPLDCNGMLGSSLLPFVIYENVLLSAAQCVRIPTTLDHVLSGANSEIQHCTETNGTLFY